MTLVQVEHSGHLTTYTNTETGQSVSCRATTVGYLLMWDVTDGTRVEFRQSRADAVTLALAVARGEEK